MENLLENLNDSQRVAVLYNDGPSLIIAGAGAGKTRVLTCKIAYLLQQGLDPWNIMALTFTNKAAREMKERIAGIVGQKSANRLWMGTFHSIFLRILRTEAAAIGFPSDFSVYDTSDTKNLLKTIVKEMQLDEKVYKPNVLYSRISNAKNSLMLPRYYAENPDMQERDASSHMPRLTQIYAKYMERCHQAHAMDFDDILVYTNILFRDHPDILAAWQERFRYILVDEYQDTNYSQYLIVKKLAEKHHRVCVVGDDSQSIYSFRGADIDNILSFQKSYPESRLFKLEQNYRSTQNIVDLANSLIAKNSRQIKKNVFSKREKGSLIRLASAFTDVEEAYLVASTILEMRLRGHDSWNEFAVLYRTNSQSRQLEEAMRKRNIPYKVYGGMSFYQHKEVKDVICYLRLIANPADEEAFKRVFNYPARGLGETTLQKMQSAADSAKVTLWDVLSRPLEYQLQVNGGTLNKLSAFHQLIANYQAKSQELPVYELTEQLLADSGISADLLQDSTVEGISRKENIQSLLTGMHDFCQERLEGGNEKVGLGDFLSEVSLLTDQDEEDDGDKVTLMTVHASKGLEFGNIVVTGLEENLFPSSMSMESERELEEERRLLYVAITRAQNNCMLTYAKSRFRNGKTEYSKPSRFLKELDRQLLDMPDGGGMMAGGPQTQTRMPSFDRQDFYPRPQVSRQQQPQQPQAQRPVQRKLSRIQPSGPQVSVPSAHASVSSSQGGTVVVSGKGTFRVGQRVLHERFGEGNILSIEGQGDNCKICVNFTHAGTKMLLLKYASMKPLD